MRFTARLIATGHVSAGIPVPDEVLTGLGGGRRPKVVATIGGHAWRTSVGVMGGTAMLPMPGEHRALAGVTPGDTVEVDLALDTAPREVPVPDDLAAALAPFPEARAFFDALPYSERRWFVMGFDDAKTAETRARRIDKAVERLRAGRGQR
jgi:hypothetical protein